MKELDQLKMLKESIARIEEETSEDWYSLSDITDPYDKLLNTLATAFFDKYEAEPEFDHDYDDIVVAFDVAIDSFVGHLFSPTEASMEQVDSLTPPQIEKIVDVYWQLEHGATRADSLH